MKGLFSIGKRDELSRPVNRVDESLMQRMAEARRRLGDTPVKPVRSPRCVDVPPLRVQATRLRQIDPKISQG